MKPAMTGYEGNVLLVSGSLRACLGPWGGLIGPPVALVGQLVSLKRHVEVLRIFFVFC